jgi:hypothetical protein
MAHAVGRSIPNPFLSVAFCLIGMWVTPPAFAQRSYGHAAGGTVHMSAPPAYHSPVSAPAYHAPVSSPHISTMRPASGFGTSRSLPPRRPIHRFPPVIVIDEFPFAFASPFLGFNCWPANCDLFWPGMLDYAVSSPGPTNYVSQVYDAPNFYGSEPDYGMERDDTPQLYLKDGTILNVTDYWLVDEQLHFAIIQEDGVKPVEEVIPFEALDLQKTVDVNTRRGFRFMLRNEPLDQYVRDHPEGPPPALIPHK